MWILKQYEVRRYMNPNSNNSRHPPMFEYYSEVQVIVFNSILKVVHSNLNLMS